MADGRLAHHHSESFATVASCARQEIKRRALKVLIEADLDAHIATYTRRDPYPSRTSQLFTEMQPDGIGDPYPIGIEKSVGNMRKVQIAILPQPPCHA